MFTSKWHMNRLGLVDFWYYVNEEFHFKDGHMLLRGSNGSGKSVTMQSFIPLLLDGNKSSERLDSFGTRSRKLENYLIEEDSDRDNRIGYLYLEFKREDSELYKTIGMGLYARKNKPLDSWYFVIEDNKRINIDINLIENGLALTKQVLKNVLNHQVIESQKEYMKKVNEALFDFKTTEEYKEVINLLLQLRSPKLSNSLKPTMINEILSNSLQTLSEDDLRPMSEAISNMDSIKDQLDALKSSHAATQSIHQVYKQYNAIVLKEKTENHLKEDKEFERIQNTIKQQESEVEVAKIQIDSNQADQKTLSTRHNLLNEEKSGLLKDDVLQLADDLEKSRQDVIALSETLARKENQEDLKNNMYIDIKGKVKQYKSEAESALYQLNKKFQDMDDIESEIEFEEHQNLKSEVMSNPSQYIESNFSYVEARVRSEMALLKVGLTEYQIKKENEIVGKRFFEQKEALEADIEKNEIDAEQAENLFNEVIEETKEKFYKINQENKILKLNETQLREVVNIIHEFKQKDDFIRIDTLVRDTVNRLLMDILEKESKLTHKLLKKNEELSESKSLLLAWQNKQDNELEVDDAAKKSRKKLNENGIQYMPLYSVLEFHDSINEEDQNYLEEVLRRAGLLSAIIVNQDDKSNVLLESRGHADTYLFTDKDVKDIETYTVKLNRGLLDIDDMFNDLGFSKSGMIIHKDWISTAISTMTMSHVEQAQYIGKRTREEHRKSMIDSLTLIVNEQSTLIESLTQDRVECTEQKQILNIEITQMPEKADLDSAKRDMIEIDERRSRLVKQVKEVKEEIEKINTEIKAQSLKIAEIALKLQIGQTFEIFLSRFEFFEAYKELLLECKSIQKTYTSNFELYISKEKQKEDIEKDLDELYREKEDLEKNSNFSKQLILQKEELLENAGYGNIKERLQEIGEECKQISSRLERLNTEEIETKMMIKFKETEISKLMVSLQLQSDRNKMFKEMYLEEMALGYCFDSLAELPTTKTVLQFCNQFNSSGKRKDEGAADLQTILHKHQGALQEYNMNLFYLFKDREDGLAQRVDINARYRGKTIKFPTLIKELEQAIQQQSTLLEENDRSLIEDILVNTLSRKIRRLIINSESWVSDMNTYINDMNTSSGLKLRLDWRSKKAENENQLDSSKLVKLLKSDVSLLKDEDIKQLSKHFRAKIDDARKASDKEEITESFHQIMKGVMDYRSWFSFTIYYEKAGERIRELTNNAFHAFSGGEKAMSMYIPLFSAVAAKFKSASEDAPLLIALDEAFAGVDEKNIDNMFELISKFKFDYIMNSQVLWGDYQSVKSLMIHELFRPENARYVTTITYEWDGNTRRLLNQ